MATIKDSRINESVFLSEWAINNWLFMDDYRKSSILICILGRRP